MSDRAESSSSVGKGAAPTARASAASERMGRRATPTMCSSASKQRASSTEALSASSAVGDPSTPTTIRLNMNILPDAKQNYAPGSASVL